ncbi:hypothetical protein EDI_093030 [Entamoeba dispar SAW760]|uniref:Uncharacterized protein n=1 Tax=Entamoeba dispar (strain ATCC PRA-260 / SAW760) TaxID=370354 RepID=B0ED95_ENTDS|nr:uncharacterized protein EDI_093030 [Entamoeba dispar SAW760]EDR27512.1 hypothetical protein EDI_093030 [Entamoeba dispar SAW760]|eukprot:EDR27512.1 hypothetical protein EDI_093030 [Entamoeba dispar SAW760]
MTIILLTSAQSSPIPIDVFLEDTNNYRPKGNAYLAQAKRMEQFKKDMEKLILEANQNVQKLEQARHKRNQQAQQVLMAGGKLN